MPENENVSESQREIIIVELKEITKLLKRILKRIDNG